MPLIKAIPYQPVRCLAAIRPAGRYLIALFLLINNLVLSAQAPSREYQLKAAFLFNFTRFVEWPAGALPADGQPLVIGILGTNPFGSFLEDMVAGEKVNGHPLTVKQYKNIEEVKACHILFMNIADPKKQEAALAHVKAKSILTVSDNASFLQSGGIVRLFTKSNKIKIEVNLEGSKAANLVISAKLLRLADIYDPKERTN